ncbi:MAG: ABC transporter ATP-binding protein [Candidatus Hodarchaeales archaeon]|jgi:putative spermidine/putrescine transport system ATP-binding protein
MPTVTLRNIGKKFGRVVALSGIDLEIKDAEYLAILGPSGCGKTTLINCITGIVDISEGKIEIDGKSVEGIPIEKRDFAMVFQNIALFPHMTVSENISYAPYVNDIPHVELKKIESEMLKLVDLLEQKDLYPRELSGGAQQKTAVARALATREKLLILDEPISALDYKVRVTLRYAIRKLVKDLGLTAIHITHDQEEAMSVADRIVILRAGEIVEIGTPQQLYSSPQTLFTMNFVGESNFLEGVVTEVVSDHEVHVSFRNNQSLGLKNGDLHFEEGESIVVAFRPENAFISKKSIGNSLIGEITGKQFIGGYIRYTISLRTEDEIILDSRLDIEPHGNIFIQLNPQEARVFRAPTYGLKKVLTLE